MKYPLYAVLVGLPGDDQEKLYMSRETAIRMVATSQEHCVFGEDMIVSAKNPYTLTTQPLLKDEREVLCRRVMDVKRMKLVA